MSEMSSTPQPEMPLPESPRYTPEPVVPDPPPALEEAPHLEATPLTERPAAPIPPERPIIEVAAPEAAVPPEALPEPEAEALILPESEPLAEPAQAPEAATQPEAESPREAVALPEAAIQPGPAAEAIEAAIAAPEPPEAAPAELPPDPHPVEAAEEEPPAAPPLPEPVAVDFDSGGPSAPDWLAQVAAGTGEVPRSAPPPSSGAANAILPPAPMDEPVFARRDQEETQPVTAAAVDAAAPGPAYVAADHPAPGVCPRCGSTDFGSGSVITYGTRFRPAYFKPAGLSMGRLHRALRPFRRLVEVEAQVCRVCGLLIMQVDTAQLDKIEHQSGDRED